MFSDKKTEKYARHWEKAEEAFTCPISFDLMTDPVTIENGDGKYLERASAEQHFDNQRTNGFTYTNPFTGSILDTAPKLIPNIELKLKIDFFKIAKAQFEAQNYTVLSEDVVGLIDFNFSEIRTQIDTTHNVVLLRDDWFYLDNESRSLVLLFKESEIALELHHEELSSNRPPEISPTFLLHFTEFLIENRKILLGVLLATALLLGLGALAVGTCGMSTVLPVAAATVLLTAIGIKGLIAFLSVGALVTGASVIAGGGWIGYSIFSHCQKTQEEPEMVQPAQEIT